MLLPDRYSRVPFSPLAYAREFWGNLKSLPYVLPTVFFDIYVDELGLESSLDS